MTARRPILLIGAHGQLGTELRSMLPAIGEVICAVREPRAEGEVRLDLADAGNIRAVVAQVDPVAVVNAAAYTAVDRAEREPEQARAINEAAPGTLARALEGRGAMLVHYSTDYVFDGNGTRPYREDDDPNPLGVYGRTKLAGEEAVRASGVPGVILRAGWLYAAQGRNFVGAIRTRWRDGSPLRVVDDQTGTPTWVRGVARVTCSILERALAAGDGWMAANGGTYHMATAGEATWLEFARALVASWGEPSPETRVQPVSTAEYGAAAPRPRYSVMDSGRLAQRLGLSLGHWREDLQAMVRDTAERA